MVNLKDFIQDVLTQVITGVAMAQKLYPGGDPYAPVVSPQGALPSGKGHIFDAHSISIHTITFDVAVTAEEGTSASGGGGIKVLGMFSGGAEVGKETSNTSVSRINFSVPVVLPRVEFPRRTPA